MRRLLCGIASILFLSSCAQERLTPPEILEQAVSRMKHLHSVRFNGSGEIRTADRTLSLTFGSGAMLEDGSVWQATLRAEGRKQTGETLRAVTDIFIAAPSEVDIRPREFSVRPTDNVFLRDARSYENGWWRLPTTGEGAMPFVPAGQLYPFPSAIVFRDVSTQGTALDHAYHYAIGLDEKMFLQSLQQAAEQRGQSFDAQATKAALEKMQISGEAWIDQDTLLLRRLSWQISRRDVNESTMTLLVDFFGHDEVPRQSFPSDVLTLPVSFSAKLRSVLSSFSPLPANSTLSSSGGLLLLP